MVPSENRSFFDGKEIKEDYIVILKEEGTAKCLWKLVKVIETIKGVRWSYIEVIKVLINLVAIH